MPDIDLIIIGGGPAGLATALSLIDLDPSWQSRMIVLEKEQHPRPKLCGGGLTPLALLNLKRLGLRLGVPHVVADEARFVYKDRKVRLPGDPAIVLTQRQEFDAWLAERARQRGVQLREATAVEQLGTRPEGLEVHTENHSYLARAIVGADGSRGVVRRWLDARERPPHVARLLEFNTPARGHESEYRQRFARFDFSPAEQGLQGYYWDFPSVVEGQHALNRGLYDGRVSHARPRARLLPLLEQWSKARGLDGDAIKPEGHPIHWFSPSNRFAAPRALLVGDALGAEPLFGEGIGIALGHSEVAAQALQRAFAHGTFTFRDYKRRMLTSYVGRYTTLRWAVARVFYRFSGSDRFVRFTWIVAELALRLLGPLTPVPDALDERLQLNPLNI